MMKLTKDNAPNLVRKLVMNCNGWLVGSAAKENVDISNLKDWDVVIPFSYWKFAASLIPNDAVPNSFGGWKCNECEISIDIWPADLSDILTSSQTLNAYHPLTNTRLNITRI